MSDRDSGVKWPPAWNPFEVFLLCLSLVSSFGLIQGNSGSAVLDQYLSDAAVTLWGAALMIGSALALTGVWCYRSARQLVAGLYLERAGLVLVGAAATIYSIVLLHSAGGVAGIRWAVCVQVAYASACFFRAWQDHRAIGRTRRLYRSLRPSREVGHGSE